MKIAFVYDRVTKFGGAERVLLALHSIWPDAPLYSAFYNPKGVPWIHKWTVIPSFLQKIPFAYKNHELFPWATPLAFESFRFDDYDVVLSVTSAEAKSIITKPNTIHICYCLTPTRYLWSHTDVYRSAVNRSIFGFFNSILFIKILPTLKNWDLLSAKRPDEYIAISQHVGSRINKYYQTKHHDVIYPPVDDLFFTKATFKPEYRNYFLLVSRAVFYKRIDIVIEAFNRLRLPLVVICDGHEKKQLLRNANSNIRILSQHLTDRELLGYYQNCRAFVYAGDEDFGIVAAEAQASGKPVIAYKTSGMSEIVIHNKTGILYTQQSVDSLMKAVDNYTRIHFSEKACRVNANRFAVSTFKIRMLHAVESLYRKNMTI